MTDATDAKPDAKATPPWGDDFDAARAWETILAARKVEAELKAKVKTFEAAEQERADAAKTAEERAAESAAKTAKDLAEAKRDLFIERAVRKFGLDESLVEFITGDDEDTILAKAERLSTIGKPADAGKDGDDEVETPPVAGRPAAALTPGHGGEVTVSDDAAAEAAAAAYRANR